MKNKDRFVSVMLIVTLVQSGIPTTAFGADDRVRIGGDGEASNSRAEVRREILPPVKPALSQPDPCTKESERDPKDPCVQAKLYKEAEEAEVISSALYATTGAFCATSCVCLITPFCNLAVGATGEIGCQVMGLATAGTDIALAIGTAKKMEKVTGHWDAAQMAGLGMFATFAAGNTVSLFVGAGLNSSSGFFKKIGDQIVTKTIEKTSDVGDDLLKNIAEKAISCFVAAAALGMAGQRATFAVEAGEEVEDAKKKKRVAMSNADLVAATTSTSSPGMGAGATGGAPPTGQPSRGGSGETAPGSIESNESRASALAAKAAQMNPAFDKAFQDLTKQPTKELFKAMLNDPNNPIGAAAGMIGNSIGGSEGQKLTSAATAAVKNATPIELTRKIASYGRGGPEGFASAISGQGGGAKKSGNGVSGLLGSLFGDKKGDAANPSGGAGSAQFGQRVPAAAPSDKGFHSPERSLFDVISTRYAHVSGPFFSGKSLVPIEGLPGDPSSESSNPYLRRK